MKIYTIDTGFFKLDGGAMFGVVPKSIWSKLQPPDQNNLCTWAMRCLLIEDGNRLILVDNGIGNKQSEKFFGFYDLHGSDTLDKSLQKLGFSADDITDNILTHLHFDHVGGSIVWNKDRTGFEPAFKNAKFWSHSFHWYHANHPNPREKASFLKENILPIQETGHLYMVDEQPLDAPSVSWETSSGHTESMLVLRIKYKDYTLVYPSDLIPSIHHIPVNYSMGYDMAPLQIMKEKQRLLQEVVKNGEILVFEHDPLNEACTVIQNEKGFKPGEVFRLSDLG